MTDPSSTSASAPSTTTPTAMPPTRPSLTLILAATPKLGIGHLGAMPWPSLKTEMGYFARVTKRVPTTQQEGARKRVNAVIMGRKTWDSIPPKFRPLKGRLNVVITRDVNAPRWREEVQRVREKGDEVEGPLVMGSLEGALEKLGALAQASQKSEQQDEKSETEVDRIFIIGGATLYNAALALPETNRILLTKIANEYECDTFFGLDVEGEQGRAEGWRRAGREEIEEHTGETVEGEVEEKGVRFEFCLFVKD